MKILFEVDKYKHLKERSTYNNNYYELPNEIEGCKFLLVSWEDDNFLGDYYLGHWVNDSFKPVHLFFGDEEGNVDLLNNRQKL